MIYFAVLEKWQTLVGALLGFGGLTFTNYQLVRFEKKKKLQENRLLSYSFMFSTLLTAREQLGQLSRIQRSGNTDDIDVVRRRLDDIGVPDLLNSKTDVLAVLNSSFVKMLSEHQLKLMHLKREYRDVEFDRLNQMIAFVTVCIDSCTSLIAHIED